VPVTVTFVPATILGVAVPVPPFATGSVPVTPVDKGKPVALVNVALVGVPKIGVTSVGLVDNTLLPEPVEVVTPVPPLATGSVPVTPVDKGSPVKLVAVPLDGVPSTPPLTKGAPAEPTFTARAVATPVPKPDTPVAIGSPVAFVKVALVGVPRIGVTNVGEVANTLAPLPVSSVKAAAKFAEVNEPKDVALPTEVTAPVKLAFVVTLPAVKPDAVPVIFVPTNADGVPKAGVTKVGEFDNTLLPVPVEVVTPVPPCKTVKAVVKPVIDVMSEFAPLAAAPKLVRALAAVDAPVPPSATAKSVIPVIVPPVIVADDDVIAPETPPVAVIAPVKVDVPVTDKLPPTVTLSPAEPS